MTEQGKKLEETGPPSVQGYIVIDPKKCQGCMSCMLACSLVHEGEENLYLSRIQVLQNSFEKFPFDITLERSHNCDLCLDTPFWKEKGGPDGKQACVVSCPLGAMKFTQNLPVGEEEDGNYTTNLRGKGWKEMGYPID